MDDDVMEDQLYKDSKKNGEKEKYYWRRISNEKEWDLYFKMTQHASLYLELDLKLHFWVWKKLIKHAHFKQNESETVIDCLEKMIDSMPVGASTEFRHFTCYLEAIYSLERSQELSPVSAERLLKLAANKLAVTYHKSSSYWDTIRNQEKKRELPDMIYKMKCIDTYKKQFDLPYMDMTPAFEECMGLLTNNADQEDKEVISSLFEKNKLEGQRITRDFWQCFDKKYHHIKLEEWISEMLDKSPQWNETAIALCEEAVVDEKKSICYHFLLAKTLVRVGMSEPSSKDKLFKALKRGIHLGRSECENMMMMYFDYAIQAASAHLSSKECLELLNDMINQSDFKLWYFTYYVASRKAIIFGLKAMVDNGKFPKEDVQQKFAEALDPVIQPELELDEIDYEFLTTLADFESERVELIKLSLLVEMQLTKATWKDIFFKWEDICLKSSKPEVMLEYTAFIRQHGTPVEVENAYLRALAKMNSINKSTDDSNYGTRHCELLLMNNLREFLAIHGGMTNDVLYLLNDLSKNLAVSSQVNEEIYYLDRHPETYKKYETRIRQDREVEVDRKVQQEIKSTQYSDSTYGVVPVTSEWSEMEKLPVEQHRRIDIGFPVFLSYLDSNITKNDIIEAFKIYSLDIVRIKMEMSPCNYNNGFAVVEFGSLEQAKYSFSHCHKILGPKLIVTEYKEKILRSKLYDITGFRQGFPVFYSNVHFKATENDVREAFKGFGLDILRINMTMSPHKYNNGFAVVEFGDLAHAKYAFTDCNNLEILGRTSFTSEFRQGELYLSHPLISRATVIIITDLPKEWNNPKRIENALLPYGYIKSVEVNDEAKTARVEYYMPVEVEAGFQALEEMLAGTGAVIRKGYAELFSSESRPTMKSAIAAEFLPRQQMKKKLDCASNDAEAGSSSQSSTKSKDGELGPSREKKIKVVSTSLSNNLTNDDFREIEIKIKFK